MFHLTLIFEALFNTYSWFCSFGFYVTAYSKDPSYQMPFIYLPSVYVNRPFPCLKLNTNLLNILSKVSFVYASVRPNVSTIAALLVVLISSYINVTIYLSRFPWAVAMPHSFTEIALEHRCVGPCVFSFTMEFSFSILSLVLIAIYERLDSKTIFNWLYKGSFVILLFREF